MALTQAAMAAAEARGKQTVLQHLTASLPNHGPASLVLYNLVIDVC